MQYYILASRTSACSHAPHHDRWKNRIANSQISIGSNGSGGFAASAASVAAAASAARVCRRAGAVAASSDGSNVATVCLQFNRSATTITAKTASRTALWLVKHTVLPVTTTHRRRRERGRSRRQRAPRQGCRAALCEASAN